ncbi:MAG TPA: hypothetical protein VJ749_03915 [Pyrinomonadaceae bacterium]|nr:hypothetical protein [Pyrinomonadaceae bacterium]
MPTARPAPPPPPPPVSQSQPQQWSPAPTQPPRKKSNAVWWILGGLAALVVIGVGLVVMIIALASLGSNTNSNLNANTRETNRNSNVTANVNANSNTANANTSVPPSGPFVDDFSEKKWNVGVSQFGRMWYDNGEYHMSSKPQTFIVMYAPSDEYSTENATVKVTARSVDGSVPSAGFGLLVHGQMSKAKRLEDYVLLIYPSVEPQYEIIMHKDGDQSSLVTRTTSTAIKSGSSPNQLEVRIKGTELSFYANGQLLTRITDSENYRRGRAGFYTSDATEVAFDNLEIDR